MFYPHPPIHFLQVMNIKYIYCQKRTLRICFYYFLYFIIVIILFSIFYTIIDLLNNYGIIHDCTTLCHWKMERTKDDIMFIDLRANYIESAHNYPEYVCPQNFRNMAEWIYGWPEQFKEKIHSLTNVDQVAPCLPDGSIIYVRVWVIDEFFDKIYPKLINKFVLITGEGDLSVPKSKHLKYIQNNDSKIIHWFGQNGMILSDPNIRFTHIPIGINCYEMANGIQELYNQIQANSISKMFESTSSVSNDIDEPLSYVLPFDVSLKNERKMVKKLVLLNFDVNTDQTGLRKKIWSIVCNQKISNNWLNFSTCINKGSGVQITQIPQIYKRNRQYPLWLSPRGNGLDCHRTWEALYLDIIPIVMNSTLISLYQDLPIIIIDDWTIVTEQFLTDKLSTIIANKKRTNIYKWEKLRNAYWRRLIFSYSRHRFEDNSKTNICWHIKKKWFVF
ncbi:unnamed protein product [Didymodactylos carnosus]|uniref:Exostosin GT47 domain-containing protein n=1 Tax=Didymodactylos carnosus TaxID=1234261 RepID=A0A813R507_9BILA|nr:unnamed protein product [Didymodactylos carnosus]CAF3558514.1 unnamed protein product [Didymodactylos carnosus]